MNPHLTLVPESGLSRAACFRARLAAKTALLFSVLATLSVGSAWAQPVNQPPEILLANGTVVNAPNYDVPAAVDVPVPNGFYDVGFPLAINSMRDPDLGAGLVTVVITITADSTEFNGNLLSTSLPSNKWSVESNASFLRFTRTASLASVNAYLNEFSVFGDDALLNERHNIVFRVSDGDKVSSVSFHWDPRDSSLFPTRPTGLSGLSLSAGALSPSFANATTSYTAAVRNAVSGITVTPTLAYAGGRVTLNGVNVPTGTASEVLPLAVGPNTITLIADNLSGTGTGTPPITYTVTVTRASDPSGLVIREFRSQGPGGTTDEYVEVFNRSSAAIVVGPSDGTSGYAIGAQAVDACPSGSTSVLAIIPNGTTIASGGSYLAANSTGYSLSSYGGAGAAAANVTWTADLCDGSGVGLFASAVTLDASTRIDAVGFASSTSPFLEEAGIVEPVGVGASETAFLRETAPGGARDTGNNASDFFLVDTQAATFGSVVARLGAPGPRNLTSPKVGAFDFALALPTKTATTFPNRFRVGITSTTGIYYFRWKVTNSTGAPITTLRLRVLTATTRNSPGYSPGVTQADFRLVSTPDVVISVPASVTALATTLEAPPTGLPLSGGYNASVAVTLPGGMLAKDASVYVNIGFMYERAGNYGYLVAAEGK